MTKLGDFELRRTDDEWNVWDVRLDGETLMSVTAAVAKGIMLRRYEPDALARGELVKVNNGIGTGKQEDSE